MKLKVSLKEIMNLVWYKHSVITAEKHRLSNPTSGEYLLTKTSVDGIEWICQSCYRHMKKEKIPPCAAKNGMSFPAKTRLFLFELVRLQNVGT